MDKPIVSVIVPHKNRLNYLRELVVSMLSQTLGEWELIIVDDNSEKDVYNHIINEFGSIERMCIIRSEDGKKGANHARNLGLRAAKGEYIVFLDSDDLLANRALSNRVLSINAEIELDFMVFHGEIFNKKPGDTGLLFNVHSSKQSDLCRFLSFDMPWITGSVIWRKSSILGIEWDEGLPSWQDWDYHIRSIVSGMSYAKSNQKADWYSRLPQYETIGRASKSPSHLDSHLALVAKIHRILKQYDGYILNLDELIMGCYYRISRIWARDNCNLNMALTVWNKAGANNYSKYYYYTGSLMLVLERIVRSRIWIAICIFIWPKVFPNRYSNTLHRSSVSSSKD